jgi:hypothetical protein
MPYCSLADSRSRPSAPGDRSQSQGSGVRWALAAASRWAAVKLDPCDPPGGPGTVTWLADLDSHVLWKVAFENFSSSTPII